MRTVILEFEHDQVVKLVNFNDEVAVYFDDKAGDEFPGLANSR